MVYLQANILTSFKGLSYSFFFKVVYVFAEHFLPFNSHAFVEPDLDMERKTYFNGSCFYQLNLRYNVVEWLRIRLK